MPSRAALAADDGALRHQMIAVVGRFEPYALVMTVPTVPEAGPPTDETPTSTRPSTGVEHRELVSFLGVLALVLLLVGAVSAAGLSAGPRPHLQPAGAADQSGGSDRGAKAERQARHEAQKQERKARQEERKARRQELRQQGQQPGATGPKVAEALTEQTGTLTTQTTTDGETVYVLQTVSGDLVLEVGPPWFWGAHHPLAPFVGQAVTVTGLQTSGSNGFAVFSINDQVIRGPGRPPWAGGPKTDGQQAPMSGPTTIPTPSPGTSPSASP